MNEHGCPDPSGVSPYFRDIWSESIRFMPLKLHARGELQRDSWSGCGPTTDSRTR